MFKKFLTVLGGIFLVIIIAGLIGAATFATRQYMMDKDSAQYANDAMKAIATDWDASQLINRAHPKMLENAKPEAFAELFDSVREIGALKQLKPCQGQSGLNYTVGGGFTTSASYVCVAEFEHGPATLTLALLKEKGAPWQIASLNIDSPFFKK